LNRCIMPTLPYKVLVADVVTLRAHRHLAEVLPFFKWRWGVSRVDFGY